MIRKIGLAAALLILATPLRTEAITQCENCACNFSCGALCFWSGGGTGHCSDTGYCVGGYNCGGTGCLTASQSEFILSLLDQQPVPTDPIQGRAAARLTSRLTQFAEENGLGDTYSAGTRFQPRGAARKLASPDLAFVARGHQATTQVTTPDLVVQFAPAHADATAAAWLSSGARAVLFLDSGARTIQVYRQGQTPQALGAEAFLDLPDLLPGWSLRVGDLFQ